MRQPRTHKETQFQNNNNNNKDFIFNYGDGIYKSTGAHEGQNSARVPRDGVTGGWEQLMWVLGTECRCAARTVFNTQPLSHLSSPKTIILQKQINNKKTRNTRLYLLSLFQVLSVILHSQTTFYGWLKTNSSETNTHAKFWYWYMPYLTDRSSACSWAMSLGGAIEEEFGTTDQWQL